MPKEITTVATTTSWNEEASTDKSTPRVSHVTFTLDMPDIKGSLSSQSLMIYLNDGKADDAAATHGDASFVFADTVTAEDFAGQAGSFVIRGQGTYTAATRRVQEDFVIVEGAGTGAFKGLEGKGVAESAGKPGEMRYVFSVL